MSDNHDNKDKGSTDKGWAEQRWFQRAFLGLLIVAGIGSVIASFVPEWQNKHPHFAAETVPGFFSAYGFAAFMFIVLVGQHLRKLVGRKEDYYEERE